MLTAGYRMPLNYTIDLIEACKNSLERLYTCRDNLDFAISKAPAEGDDVLLAKAAEAKAEDTAKNSMTEIALAGKQAVARIKERSPR